MRISVLSVLPCLLAILSGCSSICGTCYDQPETAKIITEMLKASDPYHKYDRISSMKITMEHVGKPDPAKPEQTIITTQNPDKIRFMTRFTDKVIVRGWDGKIAWKYDSASGYSKLEGDELDELRLQGALLAPGMTFDSVFSKIKLDGEAEVGGQKCWKLVLSPKAKFKSQDIVYFVSKSSKFLLKSEEIVDTKYEDIQVETVFSDYRNFDGIMLPQSYISEVKGEIMENKLVSVEFNPEVSEQLFNPPTDLKRVSGK